MAELVFWQNGDSGKTVKNAIETSFKNVNEQLSQLSQKHDSSYVFDFAVSDWNNGKITIDYSAYLKQNPCVHLYIKNGNKYSFVCGDYIITASGIELQSDLAYEGRVVIR